MTGGRVELTELLRRAGPEIMEDWQTEDVLPFEDVLAVRARGAACAVRDSTTPPVLRGTLLVNSGAHVTSAFKTRLWS
jgi:hypothetical protein